MIVIIRFNADKKEKRMKSIDQWPNKIIISDILLQNKEEVNGKRFYVSYKKTETVWSSIHWK